MKNRAMQFKKTSDFINWIQGFGYKESGKNGSSHRIFKAAGHPVLSVPDCRELSEGTKRNLIKLVLGDNYR
jgi:hypothetical protein